MISGSLAVAALLIPVVISALFGLQKKEMKKWLGQTAVTTMAAVLATVFAGVVLKSRVTIYECLFVNGMVSAVLAGLVFPAVQSKKVDCLQVLKFVCLACVLTAAYSIVTIGQTMIHGDTATASLLTRAQAEHNSFFPKSWYYVNGDIWILTMQVFVAPFSLLMKDQSLARMLGSLMVVFFTAWMLFLHSRKQFRDHSWLLAVPLMLVFLSGERDMILYQVAYTPQMIFLIAGAMLAYWVYRNKGGRKVYLGLAMLLVLLLAGGVRYAAEIVLPLWLTFMVLNYWKVRQQVQPDWKQVWKEWMRLTLSVALPAVVGLAIHLYLKRTLNVVNSAHNSMVLVSSVYDFSENILRYIGNLFDCFGFKGGAQLVSLEGIWSMCSVVMCVIVVLIVPVLQAMKLKQEDDYVQFLFAFGVIHNLIMFVLAVFLKGKDESRYLLTSVFVWILISSRYIYTYWIRQVHFEKYIWTVLFTLAAMLGCLALAANSDGWQEALGSKEAVASQLVEKGLTKGYGSFWTACGYEVYSDFGLRIGGLEMYEDEFIAHFWLIDGEVFTPEDTETFLILTEEENQRYKNFLAEKFDSPVDSFAVEGKYVYVFDYDISTDLV